MYVNITFRCHREKKKSQTRLDVVAMEELASLALYRSEVAKLARAHMLATKRINQIYKDIHNDAEDRLASTVPHGLYFIPLDKDCPAPPTSSSSLPYSYNSSEDET